MLKIRPRSNGEPEKPKWEEDDGDDKLAERLASEASVAAVYDVPLLPPMPKPEANAAPQPHKKPALPAKPKVSGQQLLDLIVEAVLDERAGVIEQDGQIYLTVLHQSDNTVTLQTVGVLRLGGVTVIHGSTVTK